MEIAQMFNSMLIFFNHPIFVILGGVDTIIVLGGLVYIGCLVAKGVLPVWYRLGYGLAKAKIAVFASGDNYSSLEAMLTDSKLFKKKNIIKMHENDIKKATGYKIFLVYWPDFKEKIDSIIHLKKDHTALVVYSPPDEEKIEMEIFKKINNQRNSIVVNFRGRLFNDLIVSLIGTSYE